MNIRPETFASLTRDVGLLKEQVTALFGMLADQKKPRDPSIHGFCQRHGISRGTYLNLRKAGKGPRETAAGVRRLISEEAERDWIRERETEASTIAAQRAATSTTP
jgi:hypothetical protein